MKDRIPPKIAVINSFAGYGRCSTTEALPVISAMRVQACPVPTAIFSNHTGFSSYYKVDFTAQMAEYFAQWNTLGFVFDGIYCGFLGEQEQIPLVTSFIGRQREKGSPVVLVDPVMGDHGQTYKPVLPEYCHTLRELVSLADIITPNITEACLLARRSYEGDFWQEEDLKELCQELHALGPEKIAVTGLRRSLPEGGFFDFLNFISEYKKGDKAARTRSLFSPQTGSSRHGTGDIFASILAADAVRGVSLETSVKKAADFIALCIRGSDTLGMPETEGVCLENYLNFLFDFPSAPD